MRQNVKEFSRRMRRVGALGFTSVASIAAFGANQRAQEENVPQDIRAFARTDEVRTVFEPTVVASPHQKANETSNNEEEEYDACSVSSEEDSKSVGILDGQMGLDNLGSLLLPVDFFLSFSITPPSDIETDSALETIVENPDFLSPFVPRGFHEMSPEQKQEVCEEARTRATNPDFLSQVREKIEGKKAKRNAAIAHKDDHSVSSAANITVDRSEHGEGWEKLKDKYPCAICQDVLAGPEILNCTHTFCGYCVQSMMDRCSCEEGLEVVHACPLCTTPIEFSIPERTLCVNIEEEVQQFPREYKAHWEERRRANVEKSPEKKAREQKAAQDRGRQTASQEGSIQQLSILLAIAALVVILMIRK